MVERGRVQSIGVGGVNLIKNTGYGCLKWFAILCFYWHFGGGIRLGLHVHVYVYLLFL